VLLFIERQNAVVGRSGEKNPSLAVASPGKHLIQQEINIGKKFFSPLADAGSVCCMLKFLEEAFMLEPQVIRRDEPGRRKGSRRRRLQNRRANGVNPGENICCRLAARLVASYYHLKLGEIVGRPRGSHDVTRARHLAMYLAHVVGGLSLSAVGAGFRRDRTTASYACHRVEDARDDPAFDAALSDLEISAGVLLELEREERTA
jgi:hypothetical protein